MPRSLACVCGRFGLLSLLFLAAGKVCAAQAASAPPDKNPPAVNGGRPTIADPAALTAPGWLETEFGLQKDLERDRDFSTPLLLKLTDRSRRLEYRLAFDGYASLGEDGTDGFGNTSAALQYLLAPQSRAGYDLAARAIVNFPTAGAGLGTKKLDFGALLLASRDFSPWIHGDFNVGLFSLTRQDAPGTDTQLLLAASFSFPFKGGRWSYTNELAYASPLAGQRAQLTTINGFTYAAHRYLVFDAALQWELYGDGAVFQVLAGSTFFLGRLF